MNKNKPSLKNTCVIIVTYNPPSEIDILIRTLHEIGLNNIVIVDNSEFNDTLDKLEESYCCKIIRNRKNLGIARALNIGCIYAIENNYNWVITLDQDSLPINELFNILIESYSMVIDKNHIGQIGVSYKSKEKYFEKKTEELVNKKKKCTPVKTIITSGTLLNLKAFDVVQGFDEYLFIDSVDFDFTLKLLKNGYISYKSNKTGLIHECGKVLYKNLYFGYNIQSSNHNYSRRYYMARNHIIISRRYFSLFPLWIIKKNYFFIKSIIQMILLESSIKLKLINTFRGIKDGFKYES